MKQPARLPVITAYIDSATLKALGVSTGDVRPTTGERPSSLSATLKEKIGPFLRAHGFDAGREILIYASRGSGFHLVQE